MSYLFESKFSSSCLLQDRFLQFCYVGSHANSSVEKLVTSMINENDTLHIPGTNVIETKA